MLKFVLVTLLIKNQVLLDLNTGIKAYGKFSIKPHGQLIYLRYFQGIAY